MKETMYCEESSVNSHQNVSNSIPGSSRRSIDLSPYGRQISLPSGLDCYEEWTEDPKYYQCQVTSTPGCPNFPSSQWTLLFGGRAPDLEKILSGDYYTTIDPKQIQELGKGFEIIFSQLTTTHRVRSYGDWSVASELWIDVLSFIMPWKEFELRDYRRYLSGISALFTSASIPVSSTSIEAPINAETAALWQKGLNDTIARGQRFRQQADAAKQAQKKAENDAWTVKINQNAVTKDFDTPLSSYRLKVDFLTVAQALELAIEMDAIASLTKTHLLLYHTILAI
ncbi:hypothetical protein DFJ58DRAFT_875780 [Suillus subalutaceus]|uniref:uncharacterized protein n=1 Tax=Suillus subalutaceus TaxID=48586 RepID=UPI001B8714BD|nr:uncharacterized protein DFJ58DRAFT_875780 [Suillus subalutaceus]KAG1829235.1 hypothetical protein DFJ58DRAFT_875780 [Suillus subalutaceus]